MTSISKRHIVFSTTCGLMLLSTMISCRTPSITGIWREKTLTQDLKVGVWTLEFKEDGTFLEHLEYKGMMLLVVDSKGTYSLKGDIVSVSGMSVRTTDDGYNDGPKTQADPFKARYQVVGSEIRRLGASGEPAVFVRQ